MHFAIRIYDVPDSGSLRDTHRKEHLDYLKQFNDQTLFAGPILTEDRTTEVGSMRLIEFSDRAAAEKHVADEPFLLHGVQKGYTIHRWRPGVSHTWRDCPRDENNGQYFIHALDNPGTAETRAELQSAHLAYLDRPAVMSRGPLVEEDDDTRKIGSALLFDLPDLDAAKEFFANEPYNKAGIYETADFYGWRFGRVFDRFKVPA
jgi:hypothetical protein